MNVKIKVSTIFVLFIMVVSCATTPSTLSEKSGTLSKKSSTLPAKYHLDDYLKPVNQIPPVKKSKFEEVDDQSIILRADRRTYYLLVKGSSLPLTFVNFTKSQKQTPL